MAETGAHGKFTFAVDGLGSTTWVARFEGDEAISELFRFDLELTSEDHDIAFDDVVGKTALLTLETEGMEPRYVHGIVNRFEHGAEGKKWAGYTATLVPKAWRMQLRHDSRIFQEMTVPEIIQKVLKGAGVTDHQLQIQGDHPVREYCVQYRESDWAFVSRLMEEEGIFYFFEHSEDKHVLVMADAKAVHRPIAGDATIVFRPPMGAMAHGESVSRFKSAQSVCSGKVALSDFQFKKPGLSLLVSTEAPKDSDLEVYDYPGEYDAPGDGSTLAKLRLEAAQAKRIVGEGESGCMRLTPGYLFTLSQHRRDDYNRQFLLTRVQHRGAQPQMTGDHVEAEQSYGVKFTVIPDDVPFRPTRATPRPTVKGVQSAIVVGPGGEEIYTDEHGRVKVQFHWDRQGKRDDKSSCWIRVSQLWAGASWGGTNLPRIGQEVLVDFMEGDPDRPIITGRVYHGTNVHPYPLPAEKTKSTIKSNSSPGGGGSNELRFEDKKGAEEIFLHGQKDWNIVIEHDKTQEIGHDEKLHVAHNRKKVVDNDQSESIGNAKSIDVGASHTETIGGVEAITVGASASRVVGAAQIIKVGGNLDVSAGKDHGLTVGQKMTVGIGGEKSESVGKSSAEIVQEDKKVTVEGAYKIGVKKSMSTDIEEDLTTHVKGEETLTVDKKIKIVCGDTKITIDKDGKIMVEGKDVDLKIDGPIKVNGKKFKLKSDGSVDVEASGAVKIKGSGVNIN